MGARAQPVFGYSDEVKEFFTRRPRGFGEAIETRRRSHEQKEKATA